MRVEHTVIYSINELTDEAREKAHAEYLEKYYHGPRWDAENRESLYEFCEEFPIDADYWKYGSGYAEIGPKMRYRDFDKCVWELTGLRLRTWLINNYESLLWSPVKFRLPSGKARVSRVLKRRSSCQFTGHCMDDELMNPIWEFINNPRGGVTLEDILNHCLQSWVHTCRSDCEYEESMEAFVEHADANGIEFYSDGRWYIST